MDVYYKVNDGRINYDSRKVHKSKIIFGNDGFYNCKNLVCWVRFKNFAFRIDEFYYFIGLREPIINKKLHEILSFEEKISKIIPLIETDFEELLNSFDKFYKTSNNFEKFRNWMYDF